MTLFKTVLFFFIFIAPLKANTIYDLIKIPNLEIYEINTTNKLRYLYAVKPFRLGINVKKNIHCLNPDKKTLNSKYKIVAIITITIPPTVNQNVPFFSINCPNLFPNKEVK